MKNLLKPLNLVFFFVVLAVLAACSSETTTQETTSISKYETTAVAFMALQNGDVELVVTDNVVANEYIKNNPESGFKAIDDQENFESEFYGLMFPKGSEYKAHLDQALKTVIENGTYTQIYQEWFGTEPNVDFLLEKIAEETIEAPGEVEMKKLVVGTDAAFAPFEFMDNGQIVGFDIDLLAAVMAEAGFEYEVNNVGWDPLFASIQGKNIDLAVSAITINDERKETYDFSIPYFESTHMIVFKEGLEINDANDIIGKRIGVQNGTTGQSAAERIIEKNK